MRHVDRASEREPAYLSGEDVMGQFFDDCFHYGQPYQLRRQEFRRADMKLLSDPRVLGPLGSLFWSKCAYCEEPLHPGIVTIDHYRPSAGATGLREADYKPDHYWWLGYEWSNLYLSCPICNELKGPKFPVEGARAPLLAEAPELAKENRLLLDPCADFPEQHLTYSDSGIVQGITPAGRATVSLLDLNRMPLARRRNRVLSRIRASLVRVSRLYTSHSFPMPPVEAWREAFREKWELDGSTRRWKSSGSLLLDAMEDHAPFSGMVRCAVYQRMWGRRRSTHPSATPGPADIARKNVRADQRARITTRRLVEIELNNFRAIAQLRIKCRQEESKDLRASWTMLLGENSCGKSSVLFAVALALMGDKRRKALKITSANVLRQGAKSGFIKLTFTGKPEHVIVRFNGRGIVMPPASQLTVLGYGATRLLPRLPRYPGLPLTGSVRVQNLFNPFVAMTNAKQWLISQATASFDYTARAIKAALALEPDARLIRGTIRGDREIFVRLHRRKIPLHELSDGYQSVLGLAVDMIRSLNAGRKGGLESAEGLVLLDEIGAHLHPKWRMRVVAGLRRAFPRVQFVATTHDPLCLRGLEDGEVTVLRRDEKHRIFPVEELPPIASMSAEQILRSEFFGLDSTIDHETEVLFEEYYRLLALPAPSAVDKRRITALRTELKPRTVMGNSPRERILLRIIDKYLALNPLRPGSRADAAMPDIIREQLKGLGRPDAASATA